MRKISTNRRHIPALAAAALALAVACTPIVRNHGYIPVAEDLAGLTVGQDTRETVIAAVGPPVTGGVSNNDALYYVQSRFVTRGAAAPVETAREVLAIRFDSAGILSNIERYGLEDGRVITLSRRVTDSNEADGALLRQILGNVGRVDAQDILNSP
ncbi:outer membrane protein assembly factor BamE [Salipiger sp. IMCC34102]|uniref:outer membrane protein assembly factor BamE n=1 Tax=Salipiger sp. IMCC34102 TaxID=2510647 RepID=UPI00101DF50F|nr:outer membrane protein assembly factor BamE [Salipiger sp. IMCC34102]RYH03229.1 outer membrane protein assembly factor BamE [Salipiger sp. IMCC34102]